jgi:anthranilate phosphoribosyltransferase
MANALAKLGTTRALLVCGQDGMDEVSLSAPTLVREVCGNRVRGFEWTAESFGLERTAATELTAADALESAVLIERVLAGQDGPATRIVLANAAAALMAAEAATTPLQGIALAKEAIASGKASKVLEQLRGA